MIIGVSRGAILWLGINDGKITCEIGKVLLALGWGWGWSEGWRKLKRW
jgi:hypothetical protein